MKVKRVINKPIRPPCLDHEDEEMSEVRQGLNMLVLCGEVVNWLLGNNMDIISKRRTRSGGQSEYMANVNKWFKHMSVKRIRPSELPVWQRKWDSYQGYQWI